MFEIRLISRLILAIGMVMALTPAAFSVGPYLESRLLPVTRQTELLEIERLPEGTAFYVHFRKVRQCDFAGLVWYQDDRRLQIDFEPSAEHAPSTRPPGEQFSGPWLVRGLTDLSRSRAFAFHRCHPLWTTVTQFY